MRDKAGGCADYLCDVDMRALANASMTEIQQAIGNRLAPEGFASDQPQVFAQVFKFRRRIECTIIQTRFQRLGASGDRCQRVIYFVNDPGRETAIRCQLLCSGDGLVCLDARRDVLAKGNYMRNLVLVIGPHRNLAYKPITVLSFRGQTLLFETFNRARVKGSAKLLFQLFTRLTCQYVEDLTTQRVTSGDALPPEFAIAIPCNNSVFTVDCIERNWKVIDYRLCQPALSFDFGGSALDLFCQSNRRFSGRLVQRRHMSSKGSLLCRGIDKPGCFFAAIVDAVKSNY